MHRGIGTHGESQLARAMVGWAASLLIALLAMVAGCTDGGDGTSACDNCQQGCCLTILR